MSNIGKNEVVFFGGDNDSWCHYSEFWLFNLLDSSWKEINSIICFTLLYGKMA